MKKVLLLLLLMVVVLTGCGKEGEAERESRVPDVQSTLEEAQEGRVDAGQGVVGDAPETTDGSGTSNAYILTFEATNLEGETVTEDCFADSKLTMINVWATYCNPCLMEMPDLGMIAESYDPEEFQLIGIISDVSEEAAEEDITYAKELVAQTGAAYPHLLLSESLFHNLVGAVEAVPTTFFVNQQGEVLGYAVGANSKEGWEEIIHEILAQME